MLSVMVPGEERRTRLGNEQIPDRARKLEVNGPLGGSCGILCAKESNLRDIVFSTWETTLSIRFF